MAMGSVIPMTIPMGYVIPMTIPMGSVIPMTTTAVPFCYNWVWILKLVALTLLVSAPDLRNS